MNKDRGDQEPWAVICSFALWYYSDYQIINLFKTLPKESILIPITHDFKYRDYESSKILEHETSNLQVAKGVVQMSVASGTEIYYHRQLNITQYSTVPLTKDTLLVKQTS